MILLAGLLSACACNKVRGAVGSLRRNGSSEEATYGPVGLRVRSITRDCQLEHTVDVFISQQSGAHG